MTENADSIETSSAMPWLVAVVGFAVLVLVASYAHAALYKWTDERGIVHYSDQLPADAVNRANYELDRQGQTIRKTEQVRPTVQHLPRTETEEQRMREAERERLLALRRDRALIESYANEAEIDLAKSRALATIDGQVQSAEALVAQMLKRREELASKQASYAPRPVPGAIKREIETIDDELARQHEYIAAKKKESTTIGARYDADKQRFRELRAPMGSAPDVSGAAGPVADAHETTLQFTSTR